MFNIENPLLVNNILPPFENIEIIKLLSRSHWMIGHEASYEREEFAFLNNIQHVGFTNVIYDIEDKELQTNFNSMLFIYSRIITNIITDKCKINFKKINRFHWNYYYKDQQGVGHIDKEQNNYLSILYNPITTDGGTQIKGKFYQDQLGQAKIFKSNWLHQGVSCKKDKARVSLNIVLEL